MSTYVRKNLVRCRSLCELRNVLKMKIFHAVKRSWQNIYKYISDIMRINTRYIIYIHLDFEMKVSRRGEGT
jgi:hypothetical protein